MGLRTIRLQGFIQFFFYPIHEDVDNGGLPIQIGNIASCNNYYQKHFGGKLDYFITFSTFHCLELLFCTESIECRHWKQLTLKAALESNTALGIFSQYFHLGQEGYLATNRLQGKKIALLERWERVILCVNVRDEPVEDRHA